MTHRTIHLVSLGCARNQVDSELMLGSLTGNNWSIVEDPGDADAIVVNTCSFIESAVDESIDTVLELAAQKTTGRCSLLVVAGCLPERFREGLAESLPEVDIFLGTGAYSDIVAAIQEHLDKQTRPCLLPDPNTASLQGADTRRVSTSPHMAYLKIAEGCSKTCTYCMIPSLRGRHRSRRPADIIAEARTLIASGIKELVLVAQETTAYGKELAPPEDLAGLMADLAGLADDVWIRFLYGHPESLDDRVLKTVAAHPTICSYFDIPIQHASTDVLKRMGRRYTRNKLVHLFDRIRRQVPDAALRTTVMVGFPGETDQDVEILLEFIESVKFDHLGVFTYSDAETLPSHKLDGHVSPQDAADRADLVMARQADISLSRNRRHLGQTYAVLVEGQNDDGRYVGRTAFQAPEVDGLTYLKTDAPPGDRFTRVTITEAYDYDLAGEPV